MDAGERERLRNYEGVVHAACAPAPDLELRTPGRALAGGGGVLGALISRELFQSEGEKLRAKHDLQDPALEVSSGLVEDLRERWGVADVRSLAMPVEDDPRALASREGGVLLHVETRGWAIYYYPTDWSHYRVAYEARARLVRGEPSEVIWDASCDHVGSEPQGSRATWDDLERNGAALLKQKLLR